mgnify:CR=1 FL=1
MSQAKVDKYKDQKKNRDKIMKREKRERILAEVIVCVVVVALIGWAGYSFYQNHKPTVVNTYTVDGAALTDYMSELNAETETETTAETQQSPRARLLPKRRQKLHLRLSQKQKAQQRQRPYLNKKEKDLPMKRNSEEGLFM